MELLEGKVRLTVKCEADATETFSRWDMPNRYHVFADAGAEQPLVVAQEISDCCTRTACTDNSNFQLHLFDAAIDPSSHGFHFLQVRSSSGCCDQTVNVSATNGELLGRIGRDWSLLAPVFTVRDGSGHKLYTVTGDLCTGGVSNDVEFLVKAAGAVVATITKTRAGVLSGIFGDVDYMAVTFTDRHLEPVRKALILAVAFTVEFTFYDGGS